MNSNVGMTMVKKDRDKIILVNKAYLHKSSANQYHLCGVLMWVYALLTEIIMSLSFYLNST